MNRSRVNRHPRIRWWQAVCALLIVGGTAPAAAAPPALMSDASTQTLQAMLAATPGPSDAETISEQFLGTPYGADTLIGSAQIPEQLTAELQRVDCFTYADYVEALKRADTPEQFVDSLTAVRYTGGVVSFATRRHFFTDWSATSPTLARDVTASLTDAAVATPKNLNQADSGEQYLPGLPVVARTVAYVPSPAVDDDVVSRLRTGDYVGAYAEDGGLDVTHVGIFIGTPAGPVFRNASSRDADNAVVDTPFFDYVQSVPGLVVLRPLR